MNRRSTLSLLSGSGQRTNTTSSGPQFSAASSPVRPLQGGLEPYTGSWSAQQAAHLLRRATFGPTIELIRQSADEGLSATLDRLFAEPPLPDKPLNLGMLPMQPYRLERPGLTRPSTTRTTTSSATETGA
ncbi:MAG: hypothetical protein IPN20_13095 [Haliscomenobacter sp.]|nr:hypothetical protein [Haliscomenobacter sp.]